MPEEFYLAAEYFVEGAMIRFPLRGSVFAIDLDGTVFINVGIAHGLTPNEATGVIFRPREIAGRSIPLRIGTFTVGQIYQDATAIVPTLEGEYTVEVGDLVTIQPLPITASTAPESAQDEGAEQLEPAAETPTEPRIAAPPDDAQPPLSASVYFQVDPLDATVFIDDVPLDGTFALLAPGPHSLRVEAPNHEPVERTFEVVGGRVDIMDIQLMPLAPMLVVLGDGIVFDVSVDGRSYGQVRELVLPPGWHDVVISVPGLQPTEYSLNLQPGMIREVAMPAGPQEPVGVPEPASGYIAVNASVGTELLIVDSNGETRTLGPFMTESLKAGIAPGEYMVHLLAPLEIRGKDGRPTEEVILVTVVSGEEVTVTASAYVSIPALPSGATLRLWSAQDLAGTFTSSDPAGVYAFRPGALRAELSRAGALEQLRQWTIEPWSLTYLDIQVSVPAAEQAPQGPVVTTTPPPPTTAPTGPSGAAASEIGTLTITSNVAGTTVTLEGPVIVTVAAGSEPVDVDLPDGFYMVSASAAGLPTIEDVAFVSKGETGNLDLRFDVGTLTVWVGTHRSDDRSVDTLVVVGGQEVAGRLLEVLGPTGWNRNAAARFTVDANALFHVVSGAEPVAGRYELRDVADDGQVSRTPAGTSASAASAASSTLGTATRLTSERSTGGTALLRWDPVPRAAAYVVEFFIDSSVTRLVNRSAQVRVPIAALGQRSSLPWCVIALNWDPFRVDAIGSDFTPEAVETCTVSTLSSPARSIGTSEDRDDDDPTDPGTGGDGGGGGGTETPDPWKPEPKAP